MSVSLPPFPFVPSLSKPCSSSTSRRRPARRQARGERGHGADGGFTLIETLVALAVFAIAALALLRLEGATVATTARLQDRQVGALVARGVAFAALTDPQLPAIGMASGAAENGGRPWRWTRRVARVGEGPMIRIDVAVTDAAGGAAGALTMLRNGG